MNTQLQNKARIDELQNRILAMQGLKRPSGKQCPDMGLGVMEDAFPGKTFPFGVTHEFISYTDESAAATNGFISALLGKLMCTRGLCLWISSRRTLFPAALKAFGIGPDRTIFVDLPRERDVLWTVEEALKCEAIAAVVGEMKELDFTQSRRLQLAVEKSRVTGFIHRLQPKSENIVACVTRWKIEPLPSRSIDNIVVPMAVGMGFPNWRVNLSKVRNGKPGVWVIEWVDNGFRYVKQADLVMPETLISVA